VHGAHGPHGQQPRAERHAGRGAQPDDVLGHGEPGRPEPQLPAAAARRRSASTAACPATSVATVDALYSKSLNSFFYTNINLPSDANSRIDAQGRRVYGTIGANGVPTVQPRFARYGTNVINLDNQSKDYAYSITGQLAKRFTGAFEGTLAYTYGRSYSVTDLTSSVALSNYQFGRVFSGSQFDQTLGPSAFDQPHRVLINATVTAPWKRFPTNVTTYASRQSGTPFTYTYFAGTGGANRGDLNVDGTNANDPIYIPRRPDGPAAALSRPR
jgi:hypothetical protein